MVRQGVQCNASLEAIKSQNGMQNVQDMWANVMLRCGETGGRVR